MRHILRSLRWLGRLALILYFVVGVAWLGLRYAVLPQVDQWRDTIARQLAQALGAQVELGAIRAEWLGLHPRLTLRAVSIVDPQRGERLELPYLHATIAWRSLVAQNLQFSRLEVAGLDVTVRRDAQGKLWVLEQALGSAQPAAPSALPESTSAPLPATLVWLLAQPQVDFSDVTLRWLDEARAAPPLALHRASLRIRNDGNAHTLSLSLSPPSALAAAIDLRLALTTAGDTAAPLDVNSLHARVYARIDALQPAAWKPWLDVPTAWQGGAVWMQASAEFAGVQAQQISMNLRVQQGQWQWENAQRVTLDAAQLHVEGAPAALARLARMTPQAQPDRALNFRVQASGLRAELPALFEDALTFDTATLSGQWDEQANGAARLVFDEVSATNTDLDVAWRGDWRTAPDAAAGLIDWQGRFQRLQAAAIRRYLPKAVSADARAWLRVGILAGQIQNADFSLRGDLLEFPFGDAPEKGDFSLRGRLTGGVIDYAATAAGDLPWPRLDAIEGSLDMRRVALTLQADRATMTPGPDLPAIALAQLHAHIPNIERNAHLTVQGQTRAPAASYLGLMRHSPLGERLDHVFAEATGTGQWEVPLTLEVPLLHSLDLTVNGEVRFAGGTLQLMPEMPPFERLQGTVAFTHDRITAPGLTGHFLGDAVTVSGGIGAQQSGLQFAGYVTSDALRDYVGVHGMQRLHGRAHYTALLQRTPARGFALDVKSDLRGLALALPAPLEKPADTPLALHARWGEATGARNTAARQQALDVTLGSNLQLRLLRRPDDAGGAGTPWFYAGALSINRPMPGALPAGLRIDVRTAFNDASAWQRVTDTFSRQLAARTTPARRLLPDLRGLRVHADRLRLFGLDFADAVLDAEHTGADDWRIAIASPQTQGALLWHAASGDTEERVVAEFDRLAINAPDGDAADQALDNKLDNKTANASNTADDATVDDALSIPSLELRARQFSFYGHTLGELSLAGVKQDDAWAIKSLRLGANGVSIEGRGLWRLRGPQRGLNLDALATVNDLGAYLTHMGAGGVMRQGQGSVQGSFFWRDLPWHTDLANLQGTLHVNLEKGRFSNVNSRAARLLELLSIQSLQRLARLDWNLDGLVREGFPFDVLRGEVRMQDGKLHTHDTRVIGPVGTIVIDGATDLRAQRHELQAVVIPNLDMSGAALAAGLAINPVVGVGAFLTQWLLKKPMENAMALEYRVRGTWNEPDIESVARTPLQAKPEANTPAR